MDGAFLGEEFDGAEKLRGVEYVCHGDASVGSEELYRGAVDHEAPVHRLTLYDEGGRVDGSKLLHGECLRSGMGAVDVEGLTIAVVADVDMFAFAVAEADAVACGEGAFGSCEIEGET